MQNFLQTTLNVTDHTMHTVVFTLQFQVTNGFLSRDLHGKHYTQVSKKNKELCSQEHFISTKD
jgi:hypothetical protein